MIDKKPVACLGWGSAAWRVKFRDEFIGWDKPTREGNLRFVVNNTRFLVLPWASLKCLASKVLALVAKRISSDWLSIYHHPIYLLETFVEKDRFPGTCYKARKLGLCGPDSGYFQKG
ncbi:MAG: Druantia anti-phage system protein DruA [Candidatus Hodarchaeota archaeon]